MLSNLKQFFDKHVMAQVEEKSSPDTAIDLAAAVLMLEISRADSDIGSEERQTMDSILVSHFQLSAEEASDLLVLAEKEVDHSVSLHAFTRSLNEKMSQEDKIKIIEHLWQVAFADAVLDKYEEYYIRKIADLLYVSHKDYIQAKHRASGD
ncbi:MAG: TerB family tellurite resistance protein [Gammaproteobacteria bacterium]|nr:TerB family tellurite resistance protein [Gammaproteobacteria bacterium]